MQNGKLKTAKRPYKPGRLSSEACKKLLYTAFEEYPDWSNKEIASVYPVHYTTVCKYRKQWMAEAMRQAVEEVTDETLEKMKRGYEAAMPSEPVDRFPWGFVVGSISAALIILAIIKWGSA